MKNWKNALISPDKPILEALKIIDTVALQIALVVDKSDRLIGTVTDGDIRRGILRNVSLQSPVSVVMNTSVTVANVGDDRGRILSLMKNKNLRHIPVVDDQHRVKDLKVLDQVIKTSRRENIVIIMAGGLGTRLRPLTEKIPKPMLKIGGKPVLETILENLMEHGFKNFYFAVNYKAEVIEDYFGDGLRNGVCITYLHETRRLGTAGALSLLPKRPENTFLVINGDILTNVNYSQLLRFHEEQQSKATMCVREFQYQVPYGVVRIEQNWLRSIDEKPTQSFFVNAGIYALEPDVLDCIPYNKDYNMPTLFKELIQQKNEATAFPIREYWLDIGRLEDYRQADDDFAEVFKQLEP